MSRPARILVVGPSWVGDMVMAQSLLIALKRHHPHSQIDVLAPVWTFALLDKMPEVSQALPMPPLARGQLGLRERIKLGKSLRAHRYDQAILLPNTWKSALIPFFAHIPLRTGYTGECRWGLLNDVRRLDKTVLTQTVQRFVALAEPSEPSTPPECPAPQLRVAAESRQQACDKFALQTQGKLLALCPGAEYGDAKRWPAAHYAELARLKRREGWQVWLFGSPKDAPVAAEINRLSHDACIDLTGKTTLSEAVDLLSLADVVISNDSGLMHVAAALNKKLIAIYGSSAPYFTPPLNENARIISLNLDCSPCFKRECPLGHLHCLVKITPQQILHEMQALSA
ncbi:lipopolysaccharide heptosyltransferase II [Methylomicrobium lacus]|uniref:lipopolysaccharide heptosyltransferase II n=1 Tax=Methylomicrobium lacus TaxID=136992 RepID=UPI0035A99208